MFSKQFSSGLFWQVVIKFLAIGLGFFTTRWLVELLPSAEYRNYNLVLAYNAVLLVLVDFGIPQTIQKIYTHSQDAKENSNFWTTITILRIFSYFIGLIIILVTYPLSQTRDLGLIISLFTAQFIIVADLNYRSICQAVGSTWQFSLTDFLGKAILVGLLILGNYVMYLNISPLYYFVTASIFAYSISLISDAFWQKKYTSLSKFDFGQLKLLASSLIYLALANLSIAIYLTTDKLFLAYFGFSDLVINSYANAYKLFEIAQVVPGLVMPAISSLIARKIVQEIDVNNRRKVLWQAAGASFIIGLALWIGVVLFGGIIISIIDSGNKYPETINLLPILSISLIFICPMLIFKDTTIFLGYEKYDLLTTCVTAITAVSLYILLIPTYGAIGASLATIVSYLLDLILKAVFLERILPKLNDNKPDTISNINQSL
jgi:O-antigen/teichoic acid export membrane protein